VIASAPPQPVLGQRLAQVGAARHAGLDEQKVRLDQPLLVHVAQHVAQAVALGAVEQRHLERPLAALPVPPARFSHQMPQNSTSRGSPRRRSAWRRRRARRARRRAAETAACSRGR